MGKTKTDQFTFEHNQMAEIAKALGHPARIAILEYLHKINACVCGDIVEEIGLAQSTISQHLKALKEVGLIEGETEGAKVCYCLNEKKLSEISSMFSCFLESGECKSCC